MSATFLVKENTIEKEIQLEVSNTILDLKKKIMEVFSLNCKAIDIYVNLEIPIRGMGKYTLENGIIQRAMDVYALDKFNIENKCLSINFKQLEDGYSQNIVNSKFGKGKYIPPGIRKQEPVKQKEIDLNDLNEFPVLC